MATQSMCNLGKTGSTQLDLIKEISDYSLYTCPFFKQNQPPCSVHVDRGSGHRTGQLHSQEINLRRKSGWRRTLVQIGQFVTEVLDIFNLDLHLLDVVCEPPRAPNHGRRGRCAEVDLARKNRLQSCLLPLLCENHAVSISVGYRVSHLRRPIAKVL